MSTTETPLSRIPFRLEDERMIASMARWMRFIATITIVGGFLMVLLTLIGSIVVSHALRTGTRIHRQRRRQQGGDALAAVEHIALHQCGAARTIALGQLGAAEQAATLGIEHSQLAAELAG